MSIVTARGSEAVARFGVSMLACQAGRIIQARTAISSSNTSIVSNESLSIFQRIVGKDAVVTEAAKLAPHCTDWTGSFQGSAAAVLKPNTTSEISDILRHCNQHGIPVVPQGGNTGLAGAAVPHRGGIVLCMEQMDRVLQCYPVPPLLLCCWHDNRIPAIAWLKNPTSIPPGRYHFVYACAHLPPYGVQGDVCSIELSIIDWFEHSHARIAVHGIELHGCFHASASRETDTLDAAASKHGYRAPLELAPREQCQIGGNVATNAGGLRFVRYGSVRASVLGLEVVLPDGTILDVLKTLQKDASGLDVKQMFIGSEGTLGVITKVAMQCPPRCTAVHTALLAVPDWQAVCSLFALAQRCLTEILSAFEFFDRASLELTTAHIDDATEPFAASAPMYILVEASGSNKAHDRQKLDSFLSEASTHVVGSALSDNDTDMAQMWKIRENISEALKRHGTVYKYDLSLPIDEMYTLVADVRSRVKAADLAPHVVVAAWGHVGDGNLHLNVADASRSEPKVVKSVLEPFIFEWVQRNRGSISAEHGIGLLKKEQLHYSRTPEAVRVMKHIKQLFDPRGIMNPGKVFD